MDCLGIEPGLSRLDWSSSLGLAHPSTFHSSLCTPAVVLCPHPLPAWILSLNLKTAFHSFWKWGVFLSQCGVFYKVSCDSSGDFVCSVCSTMPSDSMDDIELKNIQLQFPNARTLSRDDSSIIEERVETGRGSVLVAVQGNRSKPAILTYHDLGLNCK